MKYFRFLILLAIATLSFSAAAQTITVTSPTGSDTLMGGDTTTITWTTTGTIDSVTIYYRKGGLYLIEANVPNTGSYTWVVNPQITNSNYGYIRIKNAVSALYDENDSPFRFQEAPKTLTVTYPNALTDTLQAGVPNTITWDYSGNITKVKIYYSLNGGVSYGLISSYYGTNNTQSFSWTPPNSMNTTQLRVKVVNYYNSSIYDESDTNSVLNIGNTITLLSPLSANFVAGTTHDLTWSSTGSFSHVDIEYSTNWGAFITIADSTPNDGLFSWTVPSGDSGSMRLRIREHNSLSVMSTYYAYSMSTNPETFTLITPNGGEVFTEGDTSSITWTHSSNLAGTLFQADFSSDNGATWQFMTDGLTSDTAATFNIPLHVSSTTCLVRIYRNSPNIITIGDTSDATFTINLGSPTIVMTSPNGGQKYLAGTNSYTSFYTLGSMDSLNLHFSSDNGVSWTLLQSGIDPHNSNTTFTFPDIHSTQCKLKLTANNNSTVYDISDSVFTVTRLKLNKPRYWETVYSGSSSNITWTHATLSGSFVSLYYSTNSGSNWTLIDNNVANSGSYNWTIPNDSSVNCKIKIVDNANTSVIDITDGEFKLLPSPIQITSPNGGEYFTKMTYYPITWTTAPGASISKVKLYYSTDAGVSWHVINSYWNNTGTYNWYTPNVVSTQMLIKVTNYYNSGNPSGTSDAVFNVGVPLPNTITVASPNGGETLSQNSTHNITWTTTGSVDSVDLFYSLNRGTTWTSIATGELNDSTYTWNYTNLNSDKALIKIVEHSDVTVFDSSNAVFNIGYFVHLISPNGGETLTGTSTDTILWNANSGLSSVHLDFYNGSGWSSIAQTVPNTGQYAWSVPNISCTTCKVRVRNGAVHSDESDQPFTINVYTGIQLLTPNGGDTLAQGSTYPITWDTAGISSLISLQISTDSAVTWTSIVTNQANTGEYNWSVPSTMASSSCYVKISGTKNGVFSSDSSDFDFDIIAPPGTLTLVTPNGGDSLMREFNWHKIKWTKTGTITSVDVMLSLNGGTTWSNIATSVTSDSLSWFIPFSTTLSDSCLIKVQASGMSYINDYSDSLFSIIEHSHTVYISSPFFPKPRWTEGDTEVITWNTKGIIPFVDIYVSNNSGVTYSLIASSVANNMTSSTSYSWLVPHGLNSYNCRIKVVETADSTIFMARSLTITDIESITVLSPNGGEIFNGMDTIGLDYTYTGLVDNVQLAISLDSGTTWSNIHVSNDTTTPYQYVLPNITTTNALFAASSSVSLTDTSDATFTINEIPRSITLLNPNSGTVTFYGSYGTHWLSSGVANFNAYYSPDNGLSWTTALGHFYGGPNQFNWTGPGRNIDSCLFKIEDADSATIFDISDTAFSVVGYSDFTILTPNGGETYYTDSTYLIEWDHVVGWRNPTTYVDLKYSIDSGATWSFITSNINVSTDSTYLWTVPSSIQSQNCLIKVVDHISTRSENYDVSDNVFTIETATSLAITSPDSTNLLFSDSTVNITWTNTGTIANINLRYSLDSGTTWLSIDSNVINTGSYTWNTPLGIHSFIHIKIENTLYDTIYDVSSQMIMTLKTTSLTITNPNGGDTLSGGQVYPVTWDWTGQFTTQWNMYYSLDSGNTWNWITDGNIGGANYANVTETINWNVPLMNIDTAYTNCLVRVISTASDTSDAVFVINQTSTNPYVRVTSPNGGNSLVGGTSHNITWVANLDSLSTDSVNIYLSTDSGTTWVSLSTNEDNDSTFTWVVPQVNSTNCLIRIMSIVDSLVIDESDSMFSIVPSNHIIVTEPNGGLTYYSGANSLKIYWTSYLSGLPSDSIDIYFTSDSGTTWQNIATHVANTGLYGWPIPAINSSTCLIRVQSAADSTIFDVSDSVFTIGIPKDIQVRFPNGGEVFVADSTENINWVARLTTLSHDSVEVLLSIDSGAVWIVISDALENDSLATWTIPEINSTQCLIKIRSVIDTTIFDVSDAVFEITAPLFVGITSPNGGGTYAGGSTININWNARLVSRSIDSVDIHYSPDAGVTWVLIAANEPNDSTYSWTLPKINSTQCLVRIRNTADTTLTDISDSVFTIQSTNGVQEFSAIKVQVFPNPASDYVRIKSSKVFNTVEIIDIHGSIIKTTTNVANHEFRIENLPCGIYYLRLITPDEVVIKPIVKR